MLCPLLSAAAFGCKGVPWPHAVLAAAAAKVVGKPVQLMLTRAQMFTSCGHRPPTRQSLTLAASIDGKLAALRHDTLMHGSTVGDYIEPCGTGSSYVVYDTPNLQLTHTIRSVNVATPTFMRAPGETPGTLRARMRHRRVGGRAQDRSAATPPYQLRGKASIHGQALVNESPQRGLPPRRR